MPGSVHGPIKITHFEATLVIHEVVFEFGVGTRYQPRPSILVHGGFGFSCGLDASLLSCLCSASLPLFVAAVLCAGCLDFVSTGLWCICGIQSQFGWFHHHTAALIILCLVGWLCGVPGM